MFDLDNKSRQTLGYKMDDPSKAQPNSDFISPQQEAVGEFVVPTENLGHGLTYKQQLKQDAMLWAEFLYSEYKREKVLLEEAQTMPTHYDKPAA